MQKLPNSRRVAKARSKANCSCPPERMKRDWASGATVWRDLEKGGVCCGARAMVRPPFWDANGRWIADGLCASKGNGGFVCACIPRGSFPFLRDTPCPRADLCVRHGCHYRGTHIHGHWSGEPDCDPLHRNELWDGACMPFPVHVHHSESHLAMHSFA